MTGRTERMKELYSAGTFVGHVEWPVTLDAQGRLQIKSIPQEVQDDLAALHKRQMEQINGDAKRLGEVVEGVSHIVTIAEESPDSSVIETGAYLVLETHVSLK